MKLTVHLTFAGRCEEAFRFYQSCLGGTIVTMLKYGDSPVEAPAEWREKILHATLVAGDLVLAGADPVEYVPPQGFFALLEVDEAAEAERLFGLLAEGGTVGMPLQETFWAARFGVLVDQFGIPWEINCGRDVVDSRR